VFYYAKIDFTPEQISISDEKHGSFVCLNCIEPKNVSKLRAIMN